MQLMNRKSTERNERMLGHSLWLWADVFFGLGFAEENNINHVNLRCERR